ncbi:MAG: sodium:proton antiporter [Holosporales bacterium]|jgi:Na+/H+ antiporter NhaD/arsenite permease-like protein|nr:sodium:proton antiporter [Holosporales bacterium]
MDLILDILKTTILSFPLVSLLLSLACMPLIVKKFWEKHEVKILIILPLFSIILSFILIENPLTIFRHAIINDYMPFIITLFVLYILSNGIKVNVICAPTTFANIIFLVICSISSSFIGTTGASMVFLKPFLKMNRHRKQKAHLVIFFIFLVANIGGLLSPLGDPPLFLGYLHGIDFGWELKNLIPHWGVYMGFCLTALYVIDRIILKNEENELFNKKEKFSIEVSGWLNVILLLIAIAVLSIDLGMPTVLSNFCIIAICSVSYYFEKRQGEGIEFAPFKEVSETFLAIFIAMAPVLSILVDNSSEIREYLSGISNGYFWLCSIFSSILDNAPSYLLFFNMAGGNGAELMNTYPNILKAISISSVVMGSITYIGNAPNMLVRSIAQKNHIEMPSFAGYMLWSCAIILPISLFIVTFMLK